MTLVTTETDLAVRLRLSELWPRTGGGGVGPLCRNLSLSSLQTVIMYFIVNLTHHFSFEICGSFR